MITVRCSCGARGQAPPELAGKKVRCKKCSAPILIPAPEAEPAGFDDVGGYDLAEVGARAMSLGDDAFAAAPAPLPAAPPTTIPPRRRQEERRERSFWSDLLMSFTFMFRPANVLVLIGAALLALFAELVPVPFVGLVPLAMLCALYMGTIEETAGGSDDLPNGGSFEGVWTSLIMPVVRMVGVSVILALMAFLLIGLATFSMDPESDEASLVGVLVVAGVAFLWPISMLMVALGGVLTLFRVDLMVRSIVSAFVPYLAIWVALVVALGVQFGVGMMILSDEEAEATDVFADAPARAVIAVLGVYAWLVATRCIGLFYRHYNDRFAWSAG